MRFIVALALVPFLCAQPPGRDEAIARSEAALKQRPDALGTRGTLLRLYYNNPGSPDDAAAREGRRRHILWLIEHHPEAPDLGTYFGVLEANGPKADPEGHARSDGLWREQIAKDSASPKVLANAAWFFKMSDRKEARELLGRVLRKDPRNPDAGRIAGVLDVLTWLGATEIERMDVIGKLDPELRQSADSKKAGEEIESSGNPALLGGAGEFMLAQFGPAVQDALGFDDPLDVAARWIGKAHELDPASPAWRGALARVYERQAGPTLDPHWKVKLLAQAADLAGNDAQRARSLALLAAAELSAGEEENAARDARLALGMAKDDSPIHLANTVLGEVAFDQGQFDQAKEHLLASARIKAPIGANMMLAQDLLQHGDSAAVLEYLELCRGFWTFDRGFIDHFEPIIKAGKKPDLMTPYLPSSGLPTPPKPPAPEQIADPGMLRWKAVPGAESYLVEWDSQRNGRWISDTDGSVRVIPTMETSTKLESPPPGPVRWRVYAVFRSGAGAPSPWLDAKTLQ